MLSKYLICSFAVLLMPTTLFAAVGESGSHIDAAKQEHVTTVNVGDRLARFDLLKPGVHRYLRYTVTADGHRNAIDIWSREISFESKDGKRLMHVHQQWDEVGKPPVVVVQDSWFEPDTFRSVEHRRVVTRDGKPTTSAFRFLDDKVVGDDAVADNAKAGFVQVLSEPTNNWETDMEYLQALPLAKGYAANINFYDPGRDPPARYTYAVTGEDRIAAGDGSVAECWIVSIDFKDGDKVVPVRFWFAKKTQVLLREEMKSSDGSTLVKMLLSPE
jgi:hypothetical protein